MYQFETASISQRTSQTLLDNHSASSVFEAIWSQKRNSKGTPPSCVLCDVYFGWTLFVNVTSTAYLKAILRSRTVHTWFQEQPVFQRDVAPILLNCVKQWLSICQIETKRQYVVTCEVADTAFLALGQKYLMFGCMTEHCRTHYIVALLLFLLSWWIDALSWTIFTMGTTYSTDAKKAWDTGPMRGSQELS